MFDRAADTAVLRVHGGCEKEATTEAEIKEAKMNMVFYDKYVVEIVLMIYNSSKM